MNGAANVFVTRRSRRLDAVYRELAELIVGLGETEQDRWLALIEDALPVVGPSVRCGNTTGVLLEPSPELFALLESLRTEAGALAS